MALSVEWLKNLAQAKFQNGQWLFEDQDDLKQKMHNEMAKVISAMLISLEEAVVVFNHHKGDHQKMKVIVMTNQKTPMPLGFMLLMGQTQLAVTLKDGILCSKISNVKDYQYQEYKEVKYRPVFDPFVELNWQTLEGSLLSQAMLLQVFMKELIKAQHMLKP